MVLRLQTLVDPSDLCRTFDRLSASVWATLADASAYGLSYGEESLTDMLLLELKRQHAKELTITPFNRRQEGRNGADWAWWFEGKQWLGMRVQAKRLYPSGRYEALDDLVGKSKTKLQADLLLTEAKADNLFPMYCFYNFWDVTKNPVANAAFNCQTFPRSEHLLGCTLAPAADVKLQALDQGKKDFASVGPLSFPWVCLVCCPGSTGRGSDLSSRVKASIEIQMGQDAPPAPSQRGRRRRRVVPALVDDPPQYVRAALDGTVADQGLPQGVAGVVVFRDIPRERGRRSR
jgi:hypothetical protein